MSRELKELEQEYAEGKLDRIKVDLELFIKSHAERIKEWTARRKVDIDIGLRWYIVLNRTVNLRRENLDQIEEIRKEIWYRHEENAGLPDGEIIKDWTAKHSSGWRDHRVMQVIYVYLQDKERYLVMLA